MTRRGKEGRWKQTMFTVLLATMACLVKSREGDALGDELLDACGKGDMSMARSLVERGADVNAQSEVNLLAPYPLLRRISCASGGRAC